MIVITTKYVQKASSMSHIFADFKRCSKMMGEQTVTNCSGLFWLILLVKWVFPHRLSNTKWNNFPSQTCNLNQNGPKLVKMLNWSHSMFSGVCWTRWRDDQGRGWSCKSKMLELFLFLSWHLDLKVAGEIQDAPISCPIIFVSDTIQAWEGSDFGQLLTLI